MQFNYVFIRVLGFLSEVLSKRKMTHNGVSIMSSLELNIYCGQRRIQLPLWTSVKCHTNIMVIETTVAAVLCK